MTQKQIDKMIKDHIKAGPVISHDKGGNPYWSFVFFLRQGIKWQTLIIDQDIIDLASGNTANGVKEVCRSEIKAALESFKSMPFHQEQYEARV